MTSYFGLSFVLLMALGFSAGGQVVTVHSDGMTRAELIPPSDPRFVPLRNKILVRAGSNDAIEQYKNGSVILKSNHSAHIVGYTMRWTVAPPAGDPIRFNKVYWNQSALDASLDALIPKHQPRIKAAHIGHVVRPGEARLVTPFFNVSADYSVAIYGLTSSMFPQNFEAQFTTATAIDVTLDSAVYADGLCEGDDSLNLCSRINNELDGVRSVVSQVEELMKSGRDHALILNDLAQSLGAIDVYDVPNTGAAHEEIVDVYRKRLIADALKVRDARGDEAALSWVLEKSTTFSVHHKDPTAKR